MRVAHPSTGSSGAIGSAMSTPAARARASKAIATRNWSVNPPATNCPPVSVQYPFTKYDPPSVSNRHVSVSPRRTRANSPAGSPNPKALATSVAVGRCMNRC